VRHSLYVHRIEGLARLYEQVIALGPAEGDIGADLWQGDLAYTGAIGREDMYAVIAIAHPAHAGPDVAVILAHGKGAYLHIKGPDKNIKTGDITPKSPIMNKLCASWSR
jgi:hypothetical protein